MSHVLLVEDVIREVWFDDSTTSVMAQAFDNSCATLHRIGDSPAARELIAKRIIRAAINGERDVGHLSELALAPFGLKGMAMPVVNVGRDDPLPTYALATHPA